MPSTHITTWRVLENKLAIKNNLVRRGVVTESNMCVLCGMKEESCSHLFFECRLVWLVWSQCYAWLGLASLNHSDSRIHFQQFRLCNAFETVNAVWRTIWIVVVSKILSLKNKIFFKGGVVDVSTCWRWLLPLQDCVWWRLICSVWWRLLCTFHVFVLCFKYVLVSA